MLPPRMGVEHFGTIGLTALVGVSLGLLGSGGSIVMLPVLVYVAGMAPQSAVPLSLAIVGATSALGAALYSRSRDLNPRAMLSFATSGVPGAWLGSMLTAQVPPHMLMLIFAGLMLIVGFLMLRQQAREKEQRRGCYPPRCLAAGFIVGGLTGFLGVGGGFLLVPALVWFAGVDTRTAVGTSLAIIALNAAAGLVGHLGIAQIPWALAAGLSAVAVAGMLGGKRASGRIRSASLRTVFACFVILVAAGIAAKNLLTLLRSSA